MRNSLLIIIRDFEDQFTKENFKHFCNHIKDEDKSERVLTTYLIYLLIR